LAPSQAEALRLAVAAKALVITGGPGVGKTTLVNSILKVLGAKGVAVALCATTGRAAKRLTESPEPPSLWWTGYATLAARRSAWSGVW